MGNSKALLLIDIQNDYFEDGKAELVGSEKAGENAKNILEKLRKENLPVIHVQHFSVRKDATFFIPGTDGARIHENEKPLPDEKVITKYYPNSFRETGLLGYLQSNHIIDLVIAGMMTHMCV